jgi:hypothetical protein
MAPKRGRPISGESGDIRLDTRRAQVRQRVRELRLRRRAEAGPSVQRTPAQLAQGESIINFTTAEEEEAATTLVQLGLRVQGIVLPQDISAIEEEREATDVDEHQTLYPPPLEQRPYASPYQPQQQRQQTSTEDTSQQSRSGQRPLAHYFHTLPARYTTQVGSTSQRQSHDLQEQERREVEAIEEVEAVEDVEAREDVEAEEEQGERHQVEAEEEQGEQRETDSTTVLESPPSSLPIRVGSSAVTLRRADSEGASSFRALPDVPSDQSDAESEVHFAPHHSPTPEEDEEEEEQEISAEDFVIQKLYDELIHGFHGCTEEEHFTQHQTHLSDAGDNHHGMGAMFNDDAFPSVLGLQDMITPERLARERAPTPQQWQAMFCGIPAHGRQRYPTRLCLHTEQARAMEADVAYDIDSFLGFATSLAFAKKGLWSQVASQMKQNIATDVHINTSISQPHTDPERPPRTRQAMLKHTPHFMLGRVEGAHDIAVYVLFPHLPVFGDTFKSLTREQHSRWMDQVYLPALHQFYPAHYNQHIPASFQTALDNSRAHSVEKRQRQGQNYQAQRAIGYHLQPEHLAEVWDEVLRVVGSTPGLADFSDPQLFFTSKGTKLQFKTNEVRPGLGDAMEYFQSYLEDVLDLGYVELDRLYVDIGQEICPRPSILEGQGQAFDEEPQVYCWKRCCQEKYMKWMYDGQPPSARGPGQQYYTQSMVRDTGSLTSLTPKTSKHRQGGLIYSQHYNSVKEIYDAQKCFPFANDAMEELALDPHIRRAANSALGGSGRDIRTVEAGYVASKRRAHHALQAARRKSYGLRAEHRVTWAVFQGLLDRLDGEAASLADHTLSQCPSYAWAIRTEVFVDFLWRSADKFATGFEVVRAQCHRDFTTWEQTKMMAMFLRCLRHVFGGNLLQQEGALWHGRRERTIPDQPGPRVWYGLGFGTTLPRYGYCWMEPRFDWEALQFDSSVTDHVLFGNRTLQNRYLHRGGQARTFFSATRRAELALDWLGQYRRHQRICKKMVSWLVFLCLEQFRIDILAAVRAEIRPELRAEVLKGDQGLSYDYLTEVMTDGCYLMSGNKTDFKSARALARYLFDHDDGRIREHWDQRPFRMLYQRVQAGIALKNRTWQDYFEKVFEYGLLLYHWVLPYPCSTALLQTAKTGRRMWYSIKHHAGDGPGGKVWEWARKDWQPGRPVEIPEWVGWSREQWQQWIEARAGEEREES